MVLATNLVILLSLCKCLIIHTLEHKSQPLNLHILLFDNLLIVTKQLVELT